MEKDGDLALSVERKKLSQWFFDRPGFSDELLNGLDNLKS